MVVIVECRLGDEEIKQQVNTCHQITDSWQVKVVNLSKKTKMLFIFLTIRI